MDTLQSLRDHVIQLLRGGQAYETFEEIVGEFTPDIRGVMPDGAEHSAWQVLEHMRIAQRDILDFSDNEHGGYVEKRWPDDYWPQDVAPTTPVAWEKSARAFLDDRARLEQLVLDPHRDLFAPFPWGDGQTLLREALLAAEHAAYHLGQMVVLRQLLP